MDPLKEFSGREWGLAQNADSGVSTPGVVALDFDQIKNIAAQEEEAQSFHWTDDETFGKAPVHIDGERSILYLLKTKDASQFTPNHNTTANELVVVVDGILKFVHNNGADRPKPDNLEDTFYAGRVLQFRDAAVSMQAVGLFDPSRALALALFRNDKPKVKYTMT